jgi:hypothetical protein
VPSLKSAKPATASTVKRVSDSERAGKLLGSKLKPIASGHQDALRTRPDLQALVHKYGGYHLITPEAWAAWDRDYAAYYDDLRAGRAS